MKSKHLHCAYLYADGHAVLWYKKPHYVGNANIPLEWVEVHEKWTDAKLRFKGCVGFSHAAALLRLAKIATEIECTVPTLEQGSESTKALDLRCGHLCFTIDGEPLYIQTLARPGCDHHICGGEYFYQPGNDEKFDPEMFAWGGGSVRVARIYRAKTTAVAA